MSETQRRPPRSKSVHPSEPHWIVKRMSMSPWAPGEFTPRLFHCHPTLESAEAEAVRLSGAFPGKRFSVYEHVSTHKIKKASTECGCGEFGPCAEHAP